MPLKVKCPSCQQTQQMPDEVAGRKVRCPVCQTPFRVAVPGAAPASPGPGRTPTADPAPIPTRPQPRPEPGSTLNFPPAPDFSRPVARESRPRSGPAPWIYGVGGVVAAGLVVAVVLAIRATGSSPGSDAYPDPSARITLGVASRVSMPSTSTPAAPAPTTSAPPVVASTPKPAPASPPSVPPTTAIVANRTPPPVSTPPPASAPASPPPAPTASKGAPLSTSEIVARWEPSVGLVKGHGSSGTGFLVRPGILVTNCARHRR